VYPWPNAAVFGRQKVTIDGHVLFVNLLIIAKKEKKNDSAISPDIFVYL